MRTSRFRGALGRGRERGFLLIEVVLAMAVLVLVTVGLYQVMQATIMAGEEVRAAKKRSQEINGLVELVRRTVGGIPGEAAVTSSARESGAGGFAPALTFTDAPLALTFGAANAHYGPKSIVLVPQIGGLQSVAVEYEEDPDSRRATRVGAPPTLVLMRDVRGIEWTFYDMRSRSWVEKWEQTTERPRLIRLRMSLPGYDEPYVATFHVPQGGPPGAGQSPGGPDNGSNTDPDPS